MMDRTRTAHTSLPLLAGGVFWLAASIAAHEPLVMVAQAETDASHGEWIEGPEVEPQTKDGIAGASCGGTSITQNTNPNVIEVGSIACGITGQSQFDNFYARSYSIQNAVMVNCVDFAVQSTSGPAGGSWPVRVRLYSDSNGGPPTTANLVQLGPDIFVSVPNGTLPGAGFFTASFPGGVLVPGGTTLVVEMFVACRFTTCTTNPPGFPSGDGGTFFIGSNNDGQSAPSYIKAASCNLPDYATLASIGFPNMHLIQVLGTTPANNCLDALPGCNSDVAPVGGNGATNVDDLLAVINSWGQTGPPRPQGDAAPLPNGDCTVNVDDLLAIIANWGPCGTPTGACCTPAGTCSIETQAACAAAGNIYQGNGISCAVATCNPFPVNDGCVNPSIALDGTNDWNNTNATNDGPIAPCAAMDRDVWFAYSATCTGILTVDTAGTLPPFTDTVLQAFDGTTCDPEGPQLGCDDDGAIGSLSSMSFPVASGQQILIRCASFPGMASNQGPAKLNINCALLDNDSCDQPTAINVAGSIADSLDGATPEPNSPPDCGVGVQAGRWYTVVGNGNTLTASTCSTPNSQPYFIAMNVYCGPCDELNCIAASDSNSCGATGQHDSVSWCSSSGQVYRILVHGAVINPGEGDYTLLVTNGPSCNNPPPCNSPPANDECNAATAIGLGAHNATNLNATDSNPLPPGGDCIFTDPDDFTKDVWFSYLPATTGQLTVATSVTNGPVTDTCLQAFTGACGNLTEIGCDEDSGFALWALMSVQVTQGQPILIRLGTNSGTPDGPIVLTLTQSSPPPANDECAGAQVITCGSNVTITVATYPLYTVNASDPLSNCNPKAFAMDASWWYKITTGPAQTVLKLSYCTTDPDFDTLITLFSGACGSLVQVDCDDDACTAPDPGTSELCASVTPNTTYTILVQHYDPEQVGDYILTVECTGCTP